MNKPCEHENFSATVKVNRLLDVPAFSADVTIHCDQCYEQFKFIGCKQGLSPTEPRVSYDEAEIHLPIRPSSSDLDFGSGMTGFSIRIVQ